MRGVPPKVHNVGQRLPVRQPNVFSTRCDHKLGVHAFERLMSLARNDGYVAQEGGGAH